MNNPLHLRSYFKFLSRNRLYTLINLLGLSVSLMFVILIATYTSQELSVDKFQKNADRIYALGTEEDIATGYGIVPYLASRYPEIEKMTAYSSVQRSISIGESHYNVNIDCVDSTFLDIFSFKVLDGDPSVLDRTTEILVSESFARKAFGNENPIGNTVKFSDEASLTIGGIIEDFNNSLLLKSDIVMNAQLIEELFNNSISNKHMHNAGGVLLFIMAHEGTDLQSKTEDMAEYFKEFFWIYSRGSVKEVTLTPLRDIYFSKIKPSGSFDVNTGDIGLVRMLISIGLLILIFALINYINLTVAQTGFRAKEMATRRLLGASSNEIFLKFILESTLMCVLAFFMGLLLAGAFEGIFGNIFNKTLDVFGSIDWRSGSVYFIMILVLGLISGITPAIVISRYKPINVTRGSFAHKSKMVFSKVFIIFQNVITIVMVASALTMLLQINHMINAPLRYNTDNILDIWPRFQREDLFNAFRNEISNLAAVKRVSFSQGVPIDGGNNNSFTINDKNYSFQVFEGDSVYMDMLQFEILKDNGQKGAWFNETAIAELELEDKYEFKHWWSGEMTPIAGIVKNFRIGNGIADESGPVVIFIREDNIWPWSILVEVEGDHAKVYKEIEAIFHDITGIDMQAEYLNNQLRESYDTQISTYIIVLTFSIIAIVISMLGLLAMSTYFIQQRAGEIAIRKVFGSSREELFLKLTFNFLKLVLIAFIIAVPIIWYVMGVWLSDYPYRIGLSPLILIAAGFAALATAMISVSWQTIKAVNTNPADAIRD